MIRKLGRLFVPLGAMADGPFPEYYEAHRKPDRESVASGSVEQSSGEEVQNRYGQVRHGGAGYNVVCTTYRLTEHYHYWTKNNPMNVQLVPEPFVEVRRKLADRMGIRGGEKVRVTSGARALHCQGDGDPAPSGP